MNINLEVNVSIGEVVDKITILNIKIEKIKDKTKLKYLRNEKAILENKLKSIDVKDQEKFEKLFNELYEVNLSLWDIEDDIRIYEKNKNFNQEFIDLARSVYITNDKRFEIKDKINQLFNSSIREVKSYENY